MKIPHFAAVAAILTAGIVLPACVKRVDNSEKSRADYVKILDDSIASVQQRIDSCEIEIDILRNEVADRMRDFTTVANPREVGSYIIMTPFASRYPLKSTGIVARIDDNNRFELVAALSGGKAFQQIAVNSQDASAQTGIVPHDQALNYRTGALTTVLFSGEGADAVGSVIADNELNPLTLVFIQSNPVQSWKIPAENARMIAATWLLYDASRKLGELERKVPMLHEKINLLRRHKDK